MESESEVVGEKTNKHHLPFPHLRHRGAHSQVTSDALEQLPVVIAQADGEMLHGAPTTHAPLGDPHSLGEPTSWWDRRSLYSKTGSLQTHLLERSRELDHDKSGPRLLT